MSDKPETQLDATMKFRKWVICARQEVLLMKDYSPKRRTLLLTELLRVVSFPDLSNS